MVGQIHRNTTRLCLGAGSRQAWGTDGICHLGDWVRLDQQTASVDNDACDRFM